MDRLESSQGEDSGEMYDDVDIDDTESDDPVPSAELHRRFGSVNYQVPVSTLINKFLMNSQLPRRKSMELDSNGRIKQFESP